MSTHTLPLPPSQPKAIVPPGATDAHQHIFGPYARYPLARVRGYTPPEALVPAYRAMTEILGLQRYVIVQPSVFGTDNSCSLDAARELGRDHARVVAVIDDSFDAAALRALDARGVRGVRVNAGADTPADMLDAIAGLIAPLRWHLQLAGPGQALPRLADQLLALPVPVVLDHMGAVSSAAGLEHPEFRALLRLLDGGAWVKLCGYTVSAAGPPFADLLAPARAMLAAAPDRCLWGSNWPHPTQAGLRPIDDGVMLDLLAEWCGDATSLRAVLVDNPARLYGF
jgi:predicted TIM-barrel fold metal-dependent hydrolase